MISKRIQTSGLDFLDLSGTSTITVVAVRVVGDSARGWSCAEPDCWWCWTAASTVAMVGVSLCSRKGLSLCMSGRYGPGMRRLFVFGFFGFVQLSSFKYELTCAGTLTMS